MKPGDRETFKTPLRQGIVEIAFTLMLFHARIIVSLINLPCLHVLIKHIFRIYALSFIYLPSYKMVTWGIFFGGIKCALIIFTG